MCISCLQALIQRHCCQSSTIAQNLRGHNTVELRAGITALSLTSTVGRGCSISVRSSAAVSIVMLCSSLPWHIQRLYEDSHNSDQCQSAYAMWCQSLDRLRALMISLVSMLCPSKLVMCAAISDTVLMQLYFHRRTLSDFLAFLSLRAVSAIANSHLYCSTCMLTKTLQWEHFPSAIGAQKQETLTF
jgi:hypothetical protein